MSAPIVTRPALKYFGSKWRLAPRIIELCGTDHTSYVEPYAGSAAVLLQKPKVEIEVMNDLNRDVVTFFRMLRDRPKKLLQQIELTPFSRTEYLESTQVSADVSDMERARLFFIRSWQGFSGSATQAHNGWRFQSRTYDNRLSKVDLDWHGLERLEWRPCGCARCRSNPTTLLPSFAGLMAQKPASTSIHRTQRTRGPGNGERPLTSTS